MRLVPVITAILVSIGLYFAVLERDTMLAFARGGDAPAAETAAETAADTAAESPAAAPAEDTSGIRVVVRRSQAESIDSAVILRGQTRAARQVEVRAETSGRVISEPLRKGRFVQQGDTLCQLDPGTRESTLAEARARQAEAQARVPETEARVEEAHAKLAEAMISYTAAEKLSADGYASETRLKSANAAVKSAEAAVAAATWGLDNVDAGIQAAASAVAAAEREIERLTIAAPFQGLLESDTAEIGSLLQPGALCATVIQLDPIKLVGFVPETEVARVHVGAQAGAELVSGERIVGAVTFLSRAADQTTRTFQVEITVPNPDLAIRDGQTATIAIAADGARAHRLPQSALTLNNDGKLGVRTVGDDNVVAFAPVKLIRDTPDGIWVTGLPDTVGIIVVGQDFVTAGVTVIPTYQEPGQ
ncbi:MAG: efflux RND transporter periplasmic adaptor subunit [Pseudooceanicola sp.]|nr:efflux RND transporter periplasmic adaptor subunit [Pseudooceanicola sp.]